MIVVIVRPRHYRLVCESMPPVPGKRRIVIPGDGLCGTRADLIINLVPDMTKGEQHWFMVSALTCLSHNGVVGGYDALAPN